jgi:DNA-binding MarR family transcriptional regulator
VTAGKEHLLDQLETEIGALIRRIRRVVAERARSGHDDLQVAAYFILANVAETGPKRASAVVEEFGIDKGAVSRQVQALLELGLIERTPDPEDRRAAILAITDEGARRLATVSDKRRAELLGRLSTWSSEELADFVGALSRYNAALETSH